MTAMSNQERLDRFRTELGALQARYGVSLRPVVQIPNVGPVVPINSGIDLVLTDSWNGVQPTSMEQRDGSHAQ